MLRAFRESRTLTQEELSARARVSEAGRLLAVAELLGRRLGNAFTLATALNLRATVTDLAGDYRATALLLIEATRASIDARSSWTLGYALPALAGVAVRLGDLAFRRSWDAGRAAGLDDIAELAAELGRLALA